MSAAWTILDTQEQGRLRHPQHLVPAERTATKATTLRLYVS